jgi:hypothetical protein
VKIRKKHGINGTNLVFYIIKNLISHDDLYLGVGIIQWVQTSHGLLVPIPLNMYLYGISFVHDFDSTDEKVNYAL